MTGEVSDEKRDTASRVCNAVAEVYLPLTLRNTDDRV